MDDSFSALLDELLCPLCCEEIDPVDKYFYPCPCGYQICRFCWNHIREDLNNLCPACRREFDDASVQFTPPPPDEIARIQADRKRRKQGAKKPTAGAYLASNDHTDRAHLKDIKVTQRTLVYVTNMPPKYAVEDVLMGDPYFGQFGRILKLSISRRPPLTQGGKTGENQIGIHVTYASPQEALRCIQYVDGAQIENRTLHATYGQTKYCALWLQHRPCNTPNCMFLHEVVSDTDANLVVPSITKLASGPRYFGPRGRSKPGQGPASAGSSFSADLTRSNSTGSASSVRRSGGAPAAAADDDTGSDTGSALLPATANWATRKPDASSAAPRPTTPSGPPPLIQPVRTGSFSAVDDPTPAAAAAAAAAAREREREEKARQAALRKERERKAAAEAARKQALKEEAERKAAAEAEAERKRAEAKAARRKERQEAEMRRVAQEQELERKRQAELEEQERLERQERERQEEEERRRAAILDVAAQVLEVVPDVVPIPELAVHLAMAQQQGEADETKDVGAAADTKAKNPLAGLLHYVPEWVLSSTRVLLRALDRPPPLGVYTGTFRPFDTGDLMTDILNEKTQSVLPPAAAAAQGGHVAGAAGQSQLPGAFPAGGAAVNPAVAQVLGVNPGAVANPHLAALSRTASLHALQQQQQQRLPPHLLQAGGASTQPPPGMAGQPLQQQAGSETLLALRRQLEQHQIKRATTPGTGSGPPPGMMAPPPGMSGSQQQATAAVLPFNDPAIMAIRMDRAGARDASPGASNNSNNAMEPATSKPPNIFQQLHDSYAAKVQAQQQQQPSVQGAGPPPGFGLPLKPGAQAQQQQQGPLASSTPLVSPQPQQSRPPGLVGLPPRPLGAPATVPGSTPSSATPSSAPPPGFGNGLAGGFQLQPPAATVAPPPGFAGLGTTAGSPFAPVAPAGAQFGHFNHTSNAFGGHSAATAATGFTNGPASTSFSQSAAATSGASATAPAVTGPPGSSVPTTATARGFARPPLGPPPMTPGGDYSPVSPSVSTSAAAAATAFANSYFNPPQPHLAAASAFQSPPPFASSAWSTTPVSSSAFPTPAPSSSAFQQPAAIKPLEKEPVIATTYTPAQPVKPNIPPPQPHNRVLILRSDKKPDPPKATADPPAADSSAAAAAADAADKTRDPSPSPAPRTKKGKGTAAKDEPTAVAKKPAPTKSRQASVPSPSSDKPAPRAPTPEKDTPLAAPVTTNADQDPLPASPKPTAEPEVQEPQTLTLDGVDLPISVFGASRASDSLFGQLFEAAPAGGTLPPSPISYGLVPQDTPLATTSQLLTALGLGDVMREVDAWAHQVLAEAATTATAGPAAPMNMDELVATLQSFFDRGAQVLFGASPPPASAVPGHLDDDDAGKSGNTSRGDKEVETVTDFLAKLQAEFDGFNNEYVKAEVLDGFKEELVEAKKEAAHWEARLTQARKKNRKAGIA